MEKIFVGVDGGATRTSVVAIDESKNILGQAESGPANFNVIGVKTAVENVRTGILQALGSLKSEKNYGCFALAGVNFEKDKKVWQKVIEEDKFLSKLFSKPPQIINDTQAALRAGTSDKNAIVVISGTGSNCYGKNEKGEQARAGGLDYILSDEGSGFFIGSKILKSVTQSLDGRGKSTLLTKIVFKKFKISSLEELYHLIYDKPWNKTDIAKIAKLAETAAKKDDKIALSIIEQAAHDLAVMAKAVISKLGMKNKDFTIVTAGSIFKLKGLICQHFEKDVRQFAPKAKFTEQKIEPAQAAALIAYENF